MSTATARVDHLRRALTAVNGVPVSPGNRLDLLRNGEQIFPAMLAAIHDAERSIDLLTFVYWSGAIGTQFADALSRAAERGVRVRVLLDGVGAKPIDNELIDRMRDAGANVRFFRPLDLRHPLMQLVDANGFRNSVLVTEEVVDGHVELGPLDDVAGFLGLAEHVVSWSACRCRLH